MATPVVSESTTIWEGDLTKGHGTVSLDSSDAAAFPVNWAARAEGAHETTNPEELIAAAHSACYSMALSHGLAGAGFTAEYIQATAAVSFEAGVGIRGSHLTVQAKVPGISAEQFAGIAAETKDNCPVSKALAGIEITLEATLDA